MQSVKVGLSKVYVDLYSTSTQTPLTCSYMDHTVLPANNAISAFTSQSQSITALWPVLIALTHGGMTRLSWPGWLARLRLQLNAAKTQLIVMVWLSPNAAETYWFGFDADYQHHSDPSCEVRPWSRRPSWAGSSMHFIATRLLQLAVVSSARVNHSAAAAVRIVVNLSLHDHVKPTLKQLHWLPVEQRITHKLCRFVHNIHIGQAPQYLQTVYSQFLQPVADTGWGQLTQLFTFCLV